MLARVDVVWCGC